MSILARYRKRGGFRQLLELIEGSLPAKQEKLLKVIAAEDPIMAKEVQGKILTFEKVCSWKTDTLCICIEEIAMQYRVILCKIMPKETWEDLRKLLKIQDLRALEELMAQKAGMPLAGEIQAAQSALFSRIRQLDEDRVIILSMIDPSLRLNDAA